jgi:hypothetical protein
MGDLARAIEFYQMAAEYSNSPVLRSEIEWQRQVQFHEFSERDFLRESAWVTLCAGFRESTVRRAFDHISLAFCDWESASSIVAAGETCVRAAAARFRNERKLDAILRVSRKIHKAGFARFKFDVLNRPIETLMTLPYIGHITAWHLAKNLGLDVAKPDRHLSRLSATFDFCCPDHLCRALSNAVGEAPKVVDLVLWRYLADNAAMRSTTFA